MTFRDRPEFPQLVASVRAGDAAAVDALWDLLEDCQATTADVMTLYGVPSCPETVCGGCGRSYPFWDDGNVRYCSPCGARLQRAKLLGPDQDDSLRPVLACWADRNGPPGRGTDVRGWRLFAPGERFPSGSHNPHAWMLSPDGGRHVLTNLHHTEPAARRELKRRVLGLFPEVRVPCPLCTDDGLRTDACPQCHCTGTIAPADLIPPEPTDYAHYRAQTRATFDPVS